ncbi:MAG: DUF3899 domain-containing protein [Clostridia bacterium]|nr:DUF3899 domain-containing protein [Clostridia bacterium]
MEDNRFIKWLKPIIAAVVVLVLYALSFELFSAENMEELFKDLSDCFVVTGILLSGVGAISWAGTEGAFDMLAYGCKTFLGLFSTSYSKKLPKSFYDYKQERMEKNRPWLKQTLVVGLIVLAVGLMLLIPYSMVKA